MDGRLWGTCRPSESRRVRGNDGYLADCEHIEELDHIFEFVLKSGAVARSAAEQPVFHGRVERTFPHARSY